MNKWCVLIFLHGLRCICVRKSILCMNPSLMKKNKIHLLGPLAPEPVWCVLNIENDEAAYFVT